jgi:hypothetical protein
MFQFVTSEKDNHEVVINPIQRILQLISSIAATSTRQPGAGGRHAPKARSEAPVQHCPAFAGDNPKIPLFCPVAVTTRVLIAALGAGSVESATMIKANRRSALILATTLATGVLAGLTVPANAADDLNSPVFVTPSNSGAQAPTGQPAGENQAAVPDQLNESDRTLRDNAAPATSAASNEAPAARSAPVMAASGEHSVWDETSLIGKIFIGFGALLTVASAARMFMA